VVKRNTVRGNGGGFFVQFYPPGLAALEADVTYFSAGPAAGETSANNCFKRTKPKTFTYVSSESDGELPTDGC
jgi:hypothetical protein